MANNSNTPGMSSSSGGSSNSGNNNSNNNDKDNRWYFTAEQLANSPSRRQGIDADQELSFRQLTAYLIQEMGQRLHVSQLCINTAIVYMHRFYAFHSFTHFHRNGIAAAALFLAAKVEEQPRKLEHVIKVAHMCLNQEAPHPSTDLYVEQAQDLVFNENVLLQTLGFDVAIDHPHTHVVKTCHLVKACKDLAQTSYFLASNSLHLTSMCLQYRPTVVACFCIYLACKWSRWEIPQSTEGRHWFHYVDKTVTMDLLKQLTDEFLAIYEKSPARLKSKLNSIKALAQGARIDPPTNLSEASNGSSSQLVNQVEPTRRSESYSSHHRSHHTSSSHPSTQSHHHHTKTTSETGEHKSSISHKQSYPPTSGHSSRPRPERSQLVNDPQYGTLPHSGGNSKQQLPMTSSSRSSSSSTSSRSQHNVLPQVGGTNSSGQRISAHGSHDPNLYHKNRSSIPPQMNPPQLPGHKVIPKIQETTRPLVKDPISGRSVDSSKLPSKHPNNSIYASQSSSNVGIDLTRNVLQSQGNLQPQSQQQQQPQQQQQQRPYVSQSNSQPANYNQSLLNRGISGRYDQQQSVQQPTTHLQSNQKQSNESSFGITNIKPSIDENSKSGDQMEICSPPKNAYSQNSALSQQHLQQQYQQNSQQQQQQIQQQQQPANHHKHSSIFSPEWNERVSQQPNNLTNISNNINKLNFNMKSNHDSPKKSDKDRRSEIDKNLKKDKIRTSDLAQMQASSVKFSQQQQQQLQQPVEKRNEIKSNQDLFLQSSSSLPMIPSSNLPSFDIKNQQQQQQQQTHALNFSGIKRRASRDNIRFNEEAVIKDMKVRKVEPQSPPKPTFIDQRSMAPSSQQAFHNTYDQVATNENKQHIKSFPTTVNGIETNPDLVSSLLKESLCREQKYATPLIKKEPKEEISESMVFENNPIIMETLPEQILQTDVPIEQRTEEVKTVLASAAPLVGVTTTEEFMKSKSEKKKKKDKHKHKEKDKSKDKEEKKKHKKDKDRHKDRERQPEVTTASTTNDPVKIKISKEKLNLPVIVSNSTATSVAKPPPPGPGFKIKIPKERIMGELSNFQIEDISPIIQSHHQASSTTSLLKIKISKDKCGQSNHQSQESSSSLYMSSSSGSHHSGSHGSSSSSKKKDRDRDRDREKKKNSDYGKQNGSGSKESNSSSTSNSLISKGQQSNIRDI